MGDCRGTLTMWTTTLRSEWSTCVLEAITKSLNFVGNSWYLHIRAESAVLTLHRVQCGDWGAVTSYLGGVLCTASPRSGPTWKLGCLCSGLTGQKTLVSTMTI